VRFGVTVAAIVNIIIFYDVRPFSLVYVNISEEPAVSIFRVERCGTGRDCQ
jgi:hypothetical protein